MVLFLLFRALDNPIVLAIALLVALLVPLFFKIMKIFFGFSRWYYCCNVSFVLYTFWKPSKRFIWNYFLCCIPSYLLVLHGRNDDELPMAVDLESNDETASDTCTAIQVVNKCRS
ncbi:hypothetical protein BDA99DRAFT_518237 [Phascolomyces articulosus]|uniref:Uncharacterized protein n=1 Tax=Phascolomyces articulosus TaxID=60185 RepID=A0AAD5JUQ0_9FUNG|nr:hypothetical protein BDA99DRAFT_518237 [Phascolomyces articulosus]